MPDEKDGISKLEERCKQLTLERNLAIHCFLEPRASYVASSDLAREYLRQLEREEAAFNGLDNSRSLAVSDDYALIVIDRLDREDQPAVPVTSGSVESLDTKVNSGEVIVSKREVASYLVRNSIEWAAKAGMLAYNLAKVAVKGSLQFIPYSLAGFLPAKAQSYLARKLLKDEDKSAGMTICSGIGEIGLGISLAYYSNWNSNKDSLFFFGTVMVIEGLLRSGVHPLKQGGKWIRTSIGSLFLTVPYYLAKVPGCLYRLALEKAKTEKLKLTSGTGYQPSSLIPASNEDQLLLTQTLEKLKNK